METRDFSLTLWGGKAAATAPTPTKEPPASTNDILTSTQAAQLVGLSRKQFRRYQDSLPQIRQASGWRYFRRRDVLRFFEQIREQPEVVPEKPKKRKQRPKPVTTRDGGGWCSLADCPEL